MATIVDCLIIGGGPAGLTAAIYTSRFRLSTLVIDAGSSRAKSIPCTRNHAGFPGGIAGTELVARMRQQALECGAAVEDERVLRLDRREGAFLAETDTSVVAAKSVILCTGVTNRRPDVDEALHNAALAAGRFRYCPVCDGYEVIDRAVGVIGSGEHGVREALFLRSFSADITLIAAEPRHALTADQRSKLEAAGIRVVEGPACNYALKTDGVELQCAEGRLCFDALYPALGSDIHSDLARTLGAELTGEGCIVVDAHQRTTLEGLYAAGDVVIGLDQISHAMGEAGVAATTLRNDLAGA